MKKNNFITYKTAVNNVSRNFCYQLFNTNADSYNWWVQNYKYYIKYKLKQYT